MGNVSIRNLTRRASVPRFAYTKIAESTLPGWDLSLVFVGPTKARALNIQLRNKDYIPNVLSYTLGPKSGEIIICLAEAEKQAPSYAMNTRTFILYLFIHALLHIKGRVHGDIMEKCEQALLAQFAKRVPHPLPYETTHRNWNRHRDVPSKNGRRRRAC